MKKRIHLKKRRKKNKTNLLFLVLILLIVAITFTLRFFGQSVTPILLETSELEIERVSTYVASQAISSIVADDASFQNLFETVTSSDGTIQTIDFNPSVVNKILSTSTTKVLDNLKLLENGKLDSTLLNSGFFDESQIKNLKKGILQQIPIGLITKNPLLSNMGPKIPVRIHYIGDVLGNIKTNITPYGINNALVEIGLHLEVNVQIMLPYLTKQKTVSFDIPISIKMIQGKIPTYYSGGLTKDSALYTLPID